MLYSLTFLKKNWHSSTKFVKAITYHIRSVLASRRFFPENSFRPYKKIMFIESIEMHNLLHHNWLTHQHTDAFEARIEPNMPLDTGCKKCKWKSKVVNETFWKSKRVQQREWARNNNNLIFSSFARYLYISIPKIYFTTHFCSALPPINV